MANKTVEEQLRALLPKSIDDIVRANRDQLRLALATKDELKALETTIADAPVRHRVARWNVLMLHATTAGGLVSSPRLIGRLVDSGESWVTSHVVGINLEHGLVQTKRSLYRVIGPRADEQDTDLLRICAAMHEWRLGPRYGVPHIFY